MVHEQTINDVKCQIPVTFAISLFMCICESSFVIEEEKMKRKTKKGKKDNVKYGGKKMKRWRKK